MINKIENIFIDFGSSTTKIYKKNGNKLDLLNTYSIAIKKEIIEKNSISEKMINELILIISSLKKEYLNCNIKNIATAYFRNIKNKRYLINKIFIETNLSLNIISHELENFYLQNSLTSEIKNDGNILLINIGGGSTELVLIKSGKVINTQNINIGVGSIIKQFPHINIGKFNGNIEEIVKYIQKEINIFSEKIDFAIYGGGELNYMKKVGYLLEKNNLFNDINHPLKIKLDNFIKYNKKVFFDFDIEDLKNKMPNDPNWMLGARACSIIAESILTKFNISEIIPSDTNTIHGFEKKEFRNITISGSFRKHLKEIMNVKNKLIESNINILSPRFNIPKNPGEEFVIFEGEEGKELLELVEYHLEAIKNSDGLIVCSPNGYVGASSLFEIGYANSLGKRILFTEEPEEFLLNKIPHEIF